MALNLSKGEGLNLSKEAVNLKNISVRIGWGGDVDLDVSSFSLDENSQCPADGYVVYYRQLTSADGSTVHTGDVQEGSESDGDLETIKVNLGMVAPIIKKIAFTCTIHNAQARNQSFSDAKGAYIAVTNDDNGEDLCRYDLTGGYQREDALIVAELELQGNDWVFTPVETPFAGGLGGLVKEFGLSVQ